MCTCSGRPPSGGFTYQAGIGGPEFARTAAATFSLMMLGKHDAPEVKSGVNYINNQRLKLLLKETPLRKRRLTEFWKPGRDFATVVARATTHRQPRELGALT